MNVFVYGTLTDPDKAGAVLDSFEYTGDAVLSGLHRVEGTYPTLAPGGDVEGRLLWTDEIPALDHYEGVDRGLYSRVTVPLAVEAARESAAVYVGDPTALDAPADWPGTGPFAERARAYVAANDVYVTPS